MGGGVVDAVRLEAVECPKSFCVRLVGTDVLAVPTHDPTHTDTDPSVSRGNKKERSAEKQTSASWKQ